MSLANAKYYTYYYYIHLVLYLLPLSPPPLPPHIGDGMFFQWLMGIGTFLVGLVFYVCIWPQPPLFTFAMSGGVLWGCGNILTVPTLKLIGIGMTQTMVGISNAIGGWISGRLANT